MKNWFLYLFCLSSYYFYLPVGIPAQLLKSVHALFVILILLFIVDKWFRGNLNRTNSKFVLPMGIMVFSIVFSMIPAYLSWGQPLSITFFASLPYWTYFFFFYLFYSKTDIKIIEKLVLKLGMLTLSLSCLSLLLYPTILFGANVDSESINVDRGFARISIPGVGFIFLSFFLSINKYLVTREKVWITLAIAFLCGIFLTLTRQSIASSIVLASLMFFSNVKSVRSKLFTVVFIAASLIFITNLDFVQSLISISQEQASESESNVRIMSGSYFLTQFSPDILTVLFGNGEAGVGKGYYGDTVQNLKDTYGFFQSDVGFIGIYSKFGLLGIFAWILLFWRMFKAKTKPEYVYVKYYIGFFLLTGLTAAFAASSYYIVSICIAVYIANIATVKVIKSK